MSFPPKLTPCPPLYTIEEETLRLAMSYLLSIIERRPRGEFRKRRDFKVKNQIMEKAG